MAPRRRCAVCGSKQWRKEPSSGLITCSEGHVLENYRNEVNEVAELGPHAVRKRTLKSGRKKKERMSKADPKLYHGDRGRYLYYQCLQLLLRLQITALVDVWHLPPEFEVVCRDVWALHLCLLPNQPPAEPYHHLVEQYGGKKEPQQSSDPPQETDEDKGEVDEQDKAGLSDDGSSSSSSDGEEDELQQDEEMQRLLRENSEAPSSSDDEDPEQEPTQRQAPAGQKRRERSAYDSPAANIAVLMLACWTLRIPVLYNDFIGLIESYDLPYLDPVRLLPESLATHLTKQARQALSPHFAPTPMHIHKLTSRLAKLMHRIYGIYTPECNAAPLLWRAVNHLQGTPTLYILTKKLSRVVSLTLTLHHSLSPTLPRVNPLDPEYHKYDNAPVEVSLTAAIVVVLKLVYGLDGKKRVPKDRDDPACAMPNFKEYLELIKQMDEKDSEVEKRLFSVTEDMPSALELDDDMIDTYLDFCERALLPPPSESSGKDENIVLRDFFPLQRSTPVHPSQPREGAEDASPPEPLPATRLPSTSTDLHPGQAYRIYHSSDILGSLPQDCEVIIQRVAKWTGVNENYVCGVVERLERRLARWADKVRREDRGERP
ncbi:hypothetical protein BDW22DRAFT_1321340 [Trametopsis cervina]|nr:hypothetical protein BDW22DRAFT_1321340 [Trametopsis cervina]